MDETELDEIKSEKNDDENFEEELSAFYSTNVSTAHEIETKLDSDLSDSEDNASKPLLEQPEDIVETEINDDEKDYGPATSEELGMLLADESSPNPEILENQQENRDINLNIIPSLPKLFVKKKVAIYCFLLGFGLVIYALPKFFYGIHYDQIALAQSSITGKLHDKPFDSGLHFFYPWYNLIKFNKTIQTVELKKIKIFTTDKLQVKIGINIFYKLDTNKLNTFYRKYGFDSESIIRLVCLSEIQNIGQKFSIESYRANRLGIQDFFRKQLKYRLENDYYVKFYNLYTHEIKFTNVINKLNLLKMLNGVYKEKAENEKITNLTIAETARLVRFKKNKAKEIIENAKASADNLIIKKANYDLQTNIELTHLDLLNQSLNELNFGKKSMNDTQKVLSFCYLSSLINNENIRIIKPGQEIPAIGFSSKSEKLVGILSI